MSASKLDDCGSWELVSWGASLVFSKPVLVICVVIDEVVIVVDVAPVVEATVLVYSALVVEAVVVEIVVVLGNAAVVVVGPEACSLS